MNIYPNIGLMGRKQAGKNTIADHLTRYHGYVQLAFAAPMRAMAAAINPIIVNDGHSGERYNDVVAEHGYDLAKELYPEVRRFLQVLGTEAVRETLGQDVWVNHMRERIAALGDQHWVITDVRFPNEYDAVVSAPRGELWRVRRGAESMSDLHPSETSLDHAYADRMFRNDGTPEELYRKVNDAINAWERV